MEKDNDISDKFDHLVTKMVVVEDIVDKMFACLVRINKTTWGVFDSAGDRDKMLLASAREIKVLADQYITYLNKKVEVCSKM